MVHCLDPETTSGGLYVTQEFINNTNMPFGPYISIVFCNYHIILEAVKACSLLIFLILSQPFNCHVELCNLRIMNFFPLSRIVGLIIFCEG